MRPRSPKPERGIGISASGGPMALVQIPCHNSCQSLNIRTLPSRGGQALALTVWHGDCYLPTALYMCPCPCVPSLLGYVSWSFWLCLCVLQRGLVFLHCACGVTKRIVVRACWSKRIEGVTITLLGVMTYANYP